MKLALLVLVGLACACGGARRETPFIDGPPPSAIQESILAECGKPQDARAPGADKEQLVSVMSAFGREKPWCQVHLGWSARTGQIAVLEIVGYGDAAWVKRFAEAAVLPLLKDPAQDFIRAKLLYKLDGKQAIKERAQVLQGEISIEMTVDPIGAGFTSARIRVVR